MYRVCKKTTKKLNTNVYRANTLNLENIKRTFGVVM